MRLSLTIKSGLQEISKLQGKELDLQRVTVRDVEQVIEIEQWLERMFGYRFHIQQETK